MQRIPRGAVDGFIFDLDGVITDTAAVHQAAWKELFDEFLRQREGADYRPFNAEDYRSYVDGKPRYDGVQAFLESRGIRLSWGEPGDPPDRGTVCGLGNRKNRRFLEIIAREGVAAYPTSVALVRRLKADGLGVAVISASRNCAQVLEAAGLGDLFPVRVDGVEADRLGLPGKPDPAVFLEAAARLSVEPRRAAVVEDALAGVEAGRRGGFGWVIGVDRTGPPDSLQAAGADLVVQDLGELEVR